LVRKLVIQKEEGLWEELRRRRQKGRLGKIKSDRRAWFQAFI